MSEKDERITCVEEAITSHNERIEALEKKLGKTRFSQKTPVDLDLDTHLNYIDKIQKALILLQKEFEAFKEGEDDDIKEIGILREQIAELKEHIAMFHTWIKSHIEKQNNDFAELKEALNEVAQGRIGWEENIENNYRELLKKYSECEDSTIHKRFFLRLLEKLDVGSARQTDKRKCSECGAYLWSDYSPHNAGCSKQTEKKTSGGVDKLDDSLYLSFQCPNCNHTISIKKEDINVN